MGWWRKQQNVWRGWFNYVAFYQRLSTRDWMIDVFGCVGLAIGSAWPDQVLPIRSDATAWRASLAGCRVHGNVDLSKKNVGWTLWSARCRFFFPIVARCLKIAWSQQMTGKERTQDERKTLEIGQLNENKGQWRKLDAKMEHFYKFAPFFFAASYNSII